MNNFHFDFSKLVEKYAKLLFLEEIYGFGNNINVEFQSALEIYEEKDSSIKVELNRHLDKSNKHYKNNKKIPLKNKKKADYGLFDPDGMVRLKEKGVIYKPLKAHYDTVFEAIKELSNKFEIQDVLPAFEWQDFEIFIKQALENFGFYAFRTFRFKQGKKRFEVDAIARIRQDILFIDAKHWNSKTASPSALMKVAEEQLERAKNLIKVPDACGTMLSKLSYKPKTHFETFLVYPLIVVSSSISKNRIVNGIPILSLLKFNEFLNNFAAIKSQLSPVEIKKAAFQKKLDF